MVRKQLFIFTIMIFLLVAGILYAGPNQWTLTEGMYPIGAFQISMCPSNNSTLYAVCGFKASPQYLFKSTDKSNTWSQVTNYNHFMDQVLCSPEDSSTIFLTEKITNNIYKSSDGGNTMSSVTTGINTTIRITDVCYINDTSRTLYLGAGFVYKSTDGGETWSPASTGMGNVGEIYLSTAPANPLVVYATGGNSLYKSIDKGEHWSLLTTMTHSWRGICVNPSNPSDVYAIPLYDSYLYKSHDSGVTWELITSGISSSLRVLDIACNAIDSTQVFITTSNGYYKSTDSGNTWQPMNDGLGAMSPIAEDILVIPGKSPLILAATSFGVYSYTLTTTSVDKKQWEIYEEKK
jgi:photosystem II stability/assembly factor-like uncharacterized protein